MRGRRVTTTGLTTPTTDPTKISSTSRRREQHRGKAEHAKDHDQRCPVEDNPDKQDDQPRHKQEKASADPAQQVGTGVRRADRTRELRIVLDEGALDLIQQALLIFRERHRRSSHGRQVRQTEPDTQE